ncbi:phospholipase D family protein [Paraburkholderia bryophila]|uniref:Uncharacterized protein n=1 Tax=Paraburkholderia bryophila TaxID=420952 RepID=A0A329CAT2_9BURK|nr:hypothetical protein [Paraburkholderia bryophila]RAS31913.1 hypothetical protein BX591_10818 [Paraburkholderia bryophila]
MQKTLLSLIQEAKPRRALFTTYTFSVFWFETFVLPTLRNCGCEQIDVLIDAREAQRSTEEATSLHAGTAYRVIPVEMEGGAVFHPKLVYMQGDSYDNLVVSSGNLTLAGYGKNLEVLDAVSSHTDPGVFDEFAAFLDSLQAAHEFSHENVKVIEGYRQRAQAQRDRAGPLDAAARDTWLIHTLETPAADQFAVLADRVRRPETLTVLSPYHSPSGQPVQNLAATVKAFNVRVGVHAKTRIVPFAEDKMVFTEAVEYVAADTESPYRFPHAKCFELEGTNGVLVMTGSVNATAQSLETTRNVEVSLVRFLKKSPFAWKEVEPVAFEPCEFEQVGRMGPSLSLQATWTASQHIVGVLKPAQGAMRVELSIWEGPKCLEVMRDVALDDDGAFLVRMKDYFETERALRLVLHSEGIDAATWLNLEFALTADESERKLLRAANRMRAGDYHLDDIETIFKWLQGLQAKMHPVAPNKGAPPATEKEKAEPGTRPKISYDEWRNSVEQYGALARSADVARVSLEAAFRWLNRDLEGLADGDSKDKPQQQPGKSKPKSAPLSTGRRMKLLTTDNAEYEDSDEADEDEQRAGIEEESKALFQHLIESLPLALARDSQSPIVPMMVELAGCAVLKRAFAHRTAVKGVLPPVEPLVLDAWLQQYSAFDYSPENRERLLPFFCAMACCAAHYHNKSEWPALKESIGRLAGRVLATGEMETLARLALGSPRFLRVPAEDREAIATSAAAVQDCATLTEQLMLLILRILRDEQPAPRVDAPYTEAFSALRAQKRKNKPFLFGIIRGKGNQCFCGLTLHADDARRLRHERVWVCKGMSCGRPLFYELDAEYLEQNGLAGRFKEPRNA